MTSMLYENPVARGKLFTLARPMACHKYFGRSVLYFSSRAGVSKYPVAMSHETIHIIVFFALKDPYFIVVKVLV